MCATSPASTAYAWRTGSSERSAALGAPPPWLALPAPTGPPPQAAPDSVPSAGLRHRFDRGISQVASADEPRPARSRQLPAPALKSRPPRSHKRRRARASRTERGSHADRKTRAGRGSWDRRPGAASTGRVVVRLRSPRADNPFARIPACSRHRRRPTGHEDSPRMERDRSPRAEGDRSPRAE